MCLAIPMKIVELDGKNAVGERDGVRRAFRVDFLPDPKVGDYVILHAGFAIEKLREEDALADMKAAKEVEDALRSLV